MARDERKAFQISYFETEESIQAFIGKPKLRTIDVTKFNEYILTGEKHCTYENILWKLRNFWIVADEPCGIYSYLQHLAKCQNKQVYEKSQDKYWKNYHDEEYIFLWVGENYSNLLRLKNWLYQGDGKSHIEDGYYNPITLNPIRKLFISSPNLPKDCLIPSIPFNSPYDQSMFEKSISFLSDNVLNLWQF